MARQAKAWDGSGVTALRERWGREDVYIYGSVGSTNEVARELADEGAPTGTIVLARTQTGGRGREGRVWASPDKAGVYASMIFRTEQGSVAPLVTILAGVDVALSLNDAFGGGVSIKWPNDLIARNRKVGGILAEASAAGAESGVLVLGVGINVRGAQLPADLGGAIALDAVFPDVELIDVADAVVAGLERRLKSPPESLDESALEELDRLDWLRSREVTHELGEAEPVVGIAAGIAPDGALLLRPARGALRRIVAGSILATEVEDQ